MLTVELEKADRSGVRIRGVDPARGMESGKDTQ